MKNSILVMFLLSGTAFCLTGINIASGNPTHTHTDTPELKPISSFVQLDRAYKTTAVCFLGDKNCNWSQGFNKGDDYTRDAEEMCREEGYIKTSCTIPEYLFNQCPYSDKYYKECRRDNAKACVDSGYSPTCGTGYVPDENQTCPYDSAYKKCKCDPCSGYDYTYAQATAEGYTAGASCNSCGTLKYQRQNAACSGFKSCDCGGEIGASTCKSGSNTLFSNCKVCCEDTCPSGYYKTAGTNGRCNFGSETETTQCGTTCYRCTPPDFRASGCRKSCPEGYIFDNASQDYVCSPPSCRDKIMAKYPNYFYGDNWDTWKKYKFDRSYVGEGRGSYFSGDWNYLSPNEITNNFYTESDFRSEFSECAFYCRPSTVIKDKTFTGNVYLGIVAPGTDYTFSNITVNGTLTLPRDQNKYDKLTLTTNSKLIVRPESLGGYVEPGYFQNLLLFPGSGISTTGYWVNIWDTTISGNTADTPVTLRNVELHGDITSAHVLAGTSGGLYLDMIFDEYGKNMSKYSIKRNPGGKINITMTPPTDSYDTTLTLFKNPGIDTIINLPKTGKNSWGYVLGRGCITLAPDTTKKLCSSINGNATITFLTDDASKHVLPTCCSLNSGCAASSWNNGTMKCEGYSE